MKYDHPYGLVLLYAGLMIAVCCSAVSTTFAATDEPAPTPSEVLVLYNSSYTTDEDSNLLQDSRQIAEYYASARPGVTVTSLAMPLTEEITWAQYNSLVAGPLQTYLTSNNLEDEIKVIVTVKGVPLKIMGDEGFHDPFAVGCSPNCPVNFASVDAGLSLLYQDFKSTTRHTNPYYNTDTAFAENNHFKSNYFISNGLTLRYLVSRLDAYSLSDALAMIDRGLNADTSSSGYWVLDSGASLHFDSFSTANTRLTGFYKNVLYDPYPGSTYLRSSELPIMGYSSYGYLDSMGDGYVSNDPANANYLDFNLLNGAVFSTWESFNGYGFADPDQHYHGQIAEWISIGGSGGIAHVYEPYTSSKAREEIYMTAYAVGYPWVEAAYLSMPKMGYVQIVVGDPLMVIADNEAPPAVTGLAASGADTAINLSWTNPAVGDFEGVTAVRKVGSYPSSPTDGTVIYDGTGSSYSDSGLTNGTTYYYSVYAYDTTHNFSAVSQVATFPRDASLPGPVTGLDATTSTGMANLHWTNPGDPDFVRTVLVRKTGSYPANASDGTQVYSGSATSYLNVGLSNGVAYYYTAFAQDQSLNYSLPVSGSRIIVTLGSSSGGGGGGGGGAAVTNCSAVVYSDWSSTCANGLQTRTIISKLPQGCSLAASQQVLARSCQSSGQTAPAPDLAAASLTIEHIQSESKHAFSNNFKALEAARIQQSRQRYASIIGADPLVSPENKEKLVNFIACGTDSTRKLGEGERAGLLNSYFRSYGKLPATEKDWLDLLKIAHGRWPGERQPLAEREATARFLRVYEHDPVSQKDQNAIMVMAYGLLPAKRNLESERTALRTFRWVYGRVPASAFDWNTVRAIAYSGARR